MKHPTLTGEQQRLALRETVKTYHVLSNPDPLALFNIELLSEPWWKHHRQPYPEIFQLPIQDCKGFSISCTPDDHPRGKAWAKLHAPDGYWAKQIKLAQAFKRPKAYSTLAECAWELSEATGAIVALTLSTRAYALGGGPKTHNQPGDVAWAKRKIKWLWKQALPGQRLPKLVVVPDYLARNPNEHIDLYDYVRP
jgi:hypothetical protein